MTVNVKEKSNVLKELFGILKNVDAIKNFAISLDSVLLSSLGILNNVDVYVLSNLFVLLVKCLVKEFVVVLMFNVPNHVLLIRFVMLIL